MQEKNMRLPEDGQAAPDPVPETSTDFPVIYQGLAATLSITAILWAADVFGRLGFAVYSEQFLALVVALSLGMVFLRDPLRNKSPFMAKLDAAFALISVGAALYLAVQYPTLVLRQLQMPLDGLVVSAILLVAILEGVRRTMGPLLVVVIVAIIAYGLLGHLVSGPLQTRYVPPERALMYLGVDAGGMLGFTLLIAATIVIAFILFGQVLLASGAGQFFNDLSLGLMGRQRGGSAKIAIVGSGLFGTISGVVVSNIVATGMITIRIMIEGGYRRTSAGAIEAVASTGGQILPPIMGAAAFLMAEILQVPYSDIVVAAAVPALLFYVAIFVQADLEAARNRIPPIAAHLIPALGQVMARGWLFFVPFAVVISCLFWFNLRADTAALYGAIAGVGVGIIASYGTQRLKPKELWGVLVRTGNAVIDVVMIAASAGYLIGMLNITGLGFGLSYSLVQLGSSNLFLLLLIAAVVCIILGMGMPTVGVYLVLSVMIAPALVDVGIPPIAAHLFIFYLGMMSMVTPPVGIAAFFAASIAQADKMRTALEAMRFGWVAYVIPFVFVVTPSLLLDASWQETLFDVSAAIAGVWLISCAAAGWFRGDLVGLPRILLGVIGVAFLWPDHIYFGAFHILDAVAVLALLIMIATRRRPAHPQAHQTLERTPE